MSKTPPKNSMRAALGASLSAESEVFKDRLAKAEARFSDKTEEKSEPVMSDEAGTVAGTVAPDKTVAVAPKVIREAFTIPEAEHNAIDTLRGRLLGRAVAANKSEIVRAGLLLLSELDDAALVATVEKLERVKTGRPKTI